MNQMLMQDWWLQPKTCSLGCWMNQPLTHGGNLRSRISFATDGVANTLGLGETAPVAFESEYASFPLATASVANEIRDCKFSTSLQQLLSHLNWRLQVWNDLATAPVANLLRPQVLLPLIECLLSLPLPILAMYDDQNH